LRLVAESPHRYVDSEVTIRYKSPVSTAARRDAGLSEEELARRQAEAMRRLYQEERRRKYLTELQDINARRHTDYFTLVPTLTSPAPEKLASGIKTENDCVNLILDDGH